MIINTNNYHQEFWDMMRTKRSTGDFLKEGYNGITGTYALPTNTNEKYTQALNTQSIFRSFATVLHAYKNDHLIQAKDMHDIASWIAPGMQIPVFDGVGDFTKYAVGSYKLANIIRLDGDFVHDAAFDFEDYLTERLGRNFGLAEEDAFLNGTGEHMPTGILHPTKGAVTGVTTEVITADDVIALFFSVDREYRKNAVWMMNDKTAMHLRTLKDASGNYLWNNADDTILGHKVVISNYMPDAESGNRPVLFGDLHYYWIVERRPLTIRLLTEKYALYDQIAYLSYEFLDAKLIRPDAVKVLQMQ